MDDTSLHGYDPLAIVLITLAIVFAVTVVGVTVYRQRKRFPRWLRSMMVRRRLDMIRRDLYQMAEYVGNPHESEQAAWQPFEYGLAAMGTNQWDQALAHFRQAQSNANEDEDYELDVIAEAEPDEGAPPLKVQFTASVEEETGGPFTFGWDFGDGQKSTDQNPVHTYEKVGEYTATLTVTNQKGNKGTDEIDIFVETDEGEGGDGDGDE